MYTHDNNWRNTYDRINVSGLGVFIICSVAVVVCLYMMYPACWMTKSRCDNSEELVLREVGAILAFYW